MIAHLARFLRSAILILAFVTFNGLTQAESRVVRAITPNATLPVNGVISTNTTWTAGNVYVIDGTLTVASGVTLTIEPGVIVKIANYLILEVQGTLLAEGTAALPIVFTSLQDDLHGGDTNGDGSASSPAPGNWQWISFTTTSLGNRLRYVWVGYGGYSYQRSLYAQTSDLLIEDSTIMAGLGSGIYTDQAAPTVRRCTFDHNSTYGFYLNGVGTAHDVVISDSTFISNTIGAGYANLSAATANFDLSNSTVSGSAQGGVQIDGTISGTVTITSPATLPLIGANLTILPTAQVTLTPGVIVKFLDYGYLEVRGTLRADGTAAAPIIFTALKDDAHGGDSNSDGTASSAGPGNWQWILFTNTSHGNRFRHVWVGYGGYSYQHSLYLQASDLLFEDSSVAMGLGDGIYTEQAAPLIRRGTFFQNTGYGINCNGIGSTTQLIISGTTFLSNTVGAGYLNLTDAIANVDLSDSTARGSQRSGVVLTGSISGTVTITSPTTLPLIGANLTILPTAQVTLTPGVIVKFLDYGYLEVRGTLLADGTAAAPIIFTSLQDDAHGGDSNTDGTASSAAPGNWQWILFTATSHGNRFRHVWVGYGGYSYQHSLYLQASDLLFEDSTVAMGLGDGIYTEQAAPLIRRGTFFQNTGYGINCNGIGSTTQLIISGTTFLSNTVGAGYLNLTDAIANVDLSDSTARGSQRSGVVLEGTISGTVTITSPATLPLIGWRLTILPTAQVTLTPGAIVKFLDYGYVEVQGTLLAEGTTAAPIIFTALRDDAHGGDSNTDGTASSAGPGNWQWILFTATSHGNRFRHVWVGYGGYSYQHSLYLQASDLLFEDSSVAWGLGDGIYTEQAAPLIRRSAFFQNTGYGVNCNGIGPTAAFVISDTTFLSNTVGAGYVNLTAAAANFDLSGSTARGSAQSGLVLTGSISGTVTFTNSATFPIIGSGLTVLPTAQLTLVPGGLFKFLDYGYLTVQGSLVAAGTPAQPIIFTALRDDAHGGDSNSDGSASSAAPGNWQWIQFTNGSHANRLDFVWVGYGGYSYQNSLYIQTSDVRVAHSTISFGSGNGVMIDSGASPTIFSNQIISNTTGIYIASGQPTIRGNVFVGNQSNGVYNASNTICVDAHKNYWGAATGPNDPTSYACACGLGTNDSPGGNGVSNNVDYRDYITQLPFYLLDISTDTLFHGTEQINWFALDSNPTPITVTTTIEVFANGQPTLLGRVPAQNSSFAWDTTTFPDGRYELRITFRDVTEQQIGADSRQVLVNNAVAWHSGQILANETWTTDQVHVVDGQLNVASTVTLTLNPGVVVKFAPHTGITLADGATLAAPATAADPIILTALADDTAGGDTNLDGTLTRPDAGGWRGINLQGTAQLNLNAYVDLRYIQTVHFGTLTGAETWTANWLHTITDTVVIPAGVTLTIQPGAIVKLGSKLGIEVQSGGQLIANGSLAQPIIFTSLRDDALGGDTNGDGDDTLPAAGDWRWIFLNSGQATLSYVTLSYGGGTVSGNWDQTGVLRTSGSATLTLENSTVRDAFFDGVLAWGGPVTIRNSVFTGMDRAICAHPDSTVTVVNSTLDNNKIGLLIHGGTLNASNMLVYNSALSGIQYDFGTIGELRYNDVWAAPGSSSTNYVNLVDPIGTNGNLSADPRFVHAPQGDYRLTFGSPAIDAADGTAAPATDYKGMARYDDPRSANTGTPAANAAYADLGAFEFVEQATSNIDLIVTSVTGPTSAVVGETVLITWTIANQGSEVALGPWHDSIALLHQATAIWAGDALIGDGLILGPNQQATVSAQVTVPGSVLGTHYWQVTTNARGDIFEGQQSGNNSGTGQEALTLEVPQLTVDGAPVAKSFTQVGAAYAFTFTPQAGQDLLVELTSSNAQSVVELYVSQGAMPTRDQYDLRQTQFGAANVSVPVPMSLAQPYYVLAYVTSLPGGTSNITLGVRTLTFALDSSTPAQAGNVGTVTLALTGGALRADMIYTISGAGGTRTATTLQLINSTQVYATFDLTGLTLGTYDVTVADGGVTRTITAGLTVRTGNPGQLAITVLMPERVRLGRAFMATIEYVNTGDNDLIAPLIFVTSPSGALLTLDLEGAPTEETVPFLAVNANGLPGVLPPGATGRVTLSVFANSSPVQLTTRYADSSTTSAMDWEALRNQLAVSANSNPQFSAIFTQTMAQVGTTYGDYVTMLAHNANRLPATQGNNWNPLDLVALELRTAEAALGTSLTGQVVTPGYSADVSDILVTARNTTSAETFSTNTLNDGTFSFERLTPGSYTFRVEGGLIVTAPAPGTVTLTDGQALRDVVLTTTLGVQLVGQVRGPSGEAVPSAMVYLYQGATIAATAPVVNGEAYHMQGITPGDYTLVARANSYAAAYSPTVTLGNGVTTQDITMSAEALLIGRVISASVPISDAMLLATPATDEPWLYAATQSDSTGAFQLGGLSAGTYTFTLAYSGTVRQASGVVVGVGDHGNLGDVRLDGGSMVAANTAGYYANIIWGTVSGTVIDIELFKAEAYLRTTLLPSALSMFGYSTSDLWRMYLDGDSSDPPSIQSFRDGTDIVEGSYGYMKSTVGFRNTVDTADYLSRDFRGGTEDGNLHMNVSNLLHKAVINDIKAMLKQGTLTCRSLTEPGKRVIPLQDPALTMTKDQLKLEINYNNPFNIPGNIAGGIGKGNGIGGAHGQQYDDRRFFSGNVIVQANGTNSVRLRFVVTMNAIDTIDFMPGDLGSFFEMPLTVPLKFLEAYDHAYDVPFKVAFLDKQSFPDVVLPLPDINDRCVVPPPPPCPSCASGGAGSAPGVGSYDPNEKISTGLGVLGIVKPGETVLYTILFENKASATAPAQQVVITDALSSNLDWATVELVAMGFNTTHIVVPAGRNRYETTTTVVSDTNPVRINATLDPATGILQWIMRSEDALTGQLPEDPLAGFLPPNDALHSGEGYVTFRVQLRTTLVHNDTITNQARIVFDTNAPIDTNVARNTVKTLQEVYLPSVQR